MALSVRIGGSPPTEDETAEETSKYGSGAALPEVQHYLILTTKAAAEIKVDSDPRGGRQKGEEEKTSKPALQAATRMKLECSDHVFDNVLSLIYHYCALRWRSLSLS